MAKKGVCTLLQHRHATPRKVVFQVTSVNTMANFQTVRRSLACAFAIGMTMLIGHWLPLLHIAAMNEQRWDQVWKGKSAEMVSLLLKAGADVQARDSVRLDGVALVINLSPLPLGLVWGNRFVC